MSGLNLSLNICSNPPKNHDNKKTATFVTVSFSVGVTGFEPATLCSQSRCATGLRYAPKHLQNSWRREGDSNPRYSIPYDSLANCWFQPLTHLSNCADKSSAFYYSCKLLACFFSIFSRSTGKNSPTNNYFCTGEGPFPIFFHN